MASSPYGSDGMVVPAGPGRDPLGQSIPVANKLVCNIRAVTQQHSSPEYHLAKKIKMHLTKKKKATEPKVTRV